MKRYLLFQGSKYYPSGGMRDFAGDYDTVEEALEARGREDWYHIYDTEIRDNVKDEY